MNIRKVVGLGLVVVGVVLLAMRGFQYTENHKSSVGPFDFSVKEKKNVPIPTWVGVVAAIAGVVLLAVPQRKAD